MPGMEVDPDRTMPELARVLTDTAGFPWLAGVLLAAPFAAVMSSVDSFLLVASSSLVRDVYQKYVRPDASTKQLKRWSYGTTAIVGLAAFLASVQPPKYLQDVIVFASGGVAGVFLVPMAAALFWPRANGISVIAGMLGGWLTHLILYAGGWDLLGLNPFVWDLLGSGLAVYIVAQMTSPPDESLVARYFEEPAVAEQPERM